MKKLIIDFPNLRKKIVKQDGLRCSNYTNGRGTCTLRVWYGGNMPYGPYSLWQISFEFFFFFIHF
jgi:hypothetical protein